jgi:hypothetical protein
VDKLRQLSNETEMPTSNLQTSCAESWGIPLKDASAALALNGVVFSSQYPAKNAINYSKNNALNSTVFASDLTFRALRQHDSDFRGETAYV